MGEIFCALIKGEAIGRYVFVKTDGTVSIPLCENYT